MFWKFFEKFHKTLTLFCINLGQIGSGLNLALIPMSKHGMSETSTIGMCIVLFGHNAKNVHFMDRCGIKKGHY